MKKIIQIAFSASKPYIMLKKGKNYHLLGLTIAVILWFAPSGYAQDGQLFWTDGSLEQISAIDLDGTDRITNLEDLNSPAEIDVDRINNKLYWVDLGGRRIQRSDLDGSNIETILTSADGLVAPRGIAVDPTNNLIFWADQGAGGLTDGSLSKASFDGSNLETLLSNLNRPDGVALGNNTLFFTTQNSISETDTSVATATKIDRFAILSGGGPLDLSYDALNDDLYWAQPTQISMGNADGTGGINLVRSVSPVLLTGMALDLTNSLIYFSDATNGSIKSMDISGLVAPVDIVSGLDLPRGIVNDGTFIFWADSDDAEIERADIITGSNSLTLINDFISTVRGIALDGANSKFYWIDDGLDKILRADLDGSNIEEIVNTGLSTPINLALDLASGAVYWTDAGNQTIKKADISGLNQNITTVLDNVDGLNIPNGIALDLTENKIYWSDPGNQTISRADLDGNNIQVILDNADLAFPQGIAVDVNNDMIYWADGGSGEIGRATLIGGAPAPIVTSLVNPVSVVVDPVFGKIFFGTTGSGGDIRSANLDGSANGIFLSTNITQPNGIAVDAQLALPVSLSFFGGERVNSEQVQLIWQTASETDNLGFEIQGSYNGLDFSPLAFVDGRGTFFGITNYSLLVSESQAAFYRLKQIDLDGSSSFSPVIFIEGSEQTLSLQVFPNPSKGQDITLSANVPVPDDMPVLINIYTWQGKLQDHLETTWEEVNGLLRHTISSSPQGIYLLEIQLLNRKQTLKVLKN